MKTAVVTGASRGIGRAAALALHKNGWRVYGLSRTVPQDPEGITYIQCDVTDEGAVASAFEKIGTVHLLVNNAGMGVSGAGEFTSGAEVARQMAVNFSGCAHCTAAALKLMRPMKEGSIIFISSLAGIFPIPFQSLYSASKSAVTAYAHAVGLEVRQFGIKTCVLLLGDIKTSFTEHREKNIRGDREYGGKISRSVAVMEKDEQGGMSPEKAAGAVLKLAEAKKLPHMRVLGFKYKVFYFLSKILPVNLQLFVLDKMYGG